VLATRRTSLLINNGQFLKIETCRQIATLSTALGTHVSFALIVCNGVSSE